MRAFGSCRGVLTFSRQISSSRFSRFDQNVCCRQNWRLETSVLKRKEQYGNVAGKEGRGQSLTRSGRKEKQEGDPGCDRMRRFWIWGRNGRRGKGNPRPRRLGTHTLMREWRSNRDQGVKSRVWGPAIGQCSSNNGKGGLPEVWRGTCFSPLEKEVDRAHSGATGNETLCWSNWSITGP